MKRVSTDKIETVKKYIYKVFNNDFQTRYKLKVIVTGVANLYTEVNRMIINGQISSLFLSLIVVFLINFMVFKNIILSLISLIPILVSLITNFGIMGYLKVPLNAGTAMVASIAIGIGIDYAIHVIVRFIRERNSGNGINKAIKETLYETGRAIFFNMFSVTIGFLVLVFSEFVPLVQFGLLVSLNMITSGIGSLLIIPAILMMLLRTVPIFLWFTQTSLKTKKVKSIMLRMMSDTI
jgi:predicted RND superfamily exporter protein